MEPETSSRWVGVGLVLVLAAAGLAYAPSLRDPLLSDDFILIHASAHPADLLRTFTKPAGDGAMRPVGDLVFGTYRLFAGPDPLRWHLLDLALHLANILLLYWFCVRLRFSGRRALLACALFALHPAHAESVAWVADTFDPLAALFSLLTLIALTFEGTAAWIAAPVLTALAILSKESAYALPAIALSIFAGRWKRVLPCVLAAGALFLHRWQVFGGPGGYVDAATGRAQLFNVTPLSALKALVYRPWRTLLMPVDWAVPPGTVLTVLLVAMCAALCVLAFRPRAPRRIQLLLTAAIVASLLPPVHLALIGPDLLGSRVFYLPSVVFCIWLSLIPRGWVFGGLAVVFSFFALRHNLAVRSDVARLSKRACEAGAYAVIDGDGRLTVRGLPRSIDGVFFFANGFEECVRAASGNAGARVSTTAEGGAGKVLYWDSQLRKLSAGSPY